MAARTRHRKAGIEQAPEMRIYYAGLWYDTGIYLQESYIHSQTRPSDSSSGDQTGTVVSTIAATSRPYNIIIDPATRTAATPRPAYGFCDEPAAAFPLAVAVVDEFV